jgi:hypothetical protein
VLSKLVTPGVLQWPTSSQAWGQRCWLGGAQSIAETGSDVLGSLQVIRCDGRDRKSGWSVRRRWLAPSFACSLSTTTFCDVFSLVCAVNFPRVFSITSYGVTASISSVTVAIVNSDGLYVELGLGRVI